MRARFLCFLTSVSGGRLPAEALSDIVVERDTQRRDTWVVAGEVQQDE